MAISKTSEDSYARQNAATWNQDMRLATCERSLLMLSDLLRVNALF